MLLLLLLSISPIVRVGVTHSIPVSASNRRVTGGASSKPGLGGMDSTMLAFRPTLPQNSVHDPGPDQLRFTPYASSTSRASTTAPNL